MRKSIILWTVFLVMSYAQETGARYLIITHDYFYDAVIPLGEWKHKKGMRAKIVKLSEIGSSAYEIKNYIVNAYNTWPIRPEYLLLVGSPTYLPFTTVSGTYSDNYYTDIQGDMYNEILSGRLTVRYASEAQTVINKILLYERTPFIDDSLWFRKACLIANIDHDPYDDSIYWSDVHYAAGLMVDNGFTKIDTLSDVYGHNHTHVHAAVDSGCSIVMYRGTGVNNWSYPFACNPSQTQNNAKLPIVLSTTCRTMGTGSTPASAEYWLLTGTPTTPRGAAGYFATTTTVVNQAYLRSAVAKGFHQALFELGRRTFGECCENGRQRVYTMYPYQGGAAEYRGFTTLGDPEMNIWTSTPVSLVVEHPAVIPIEQAVFTINVVQAADLMPVENAAVCVMSKIDTMLYHTEYTDSAGNADFTLSPNMIDDTVYVTVTGKNLAPYESYMRTIVPGCYIVYHNSLIDDSLGGNNDGIVNPGEDINLLLCVKNLGDSTATNVSGLLKTNDPYTLITDSIKYFGAIPGHDSLWIGPDGFHFHVGDNCPDNHIVNFGLFCQDINDSVWLSDFEHQVMRAALSFERAEITGGNNNQIFEPGETVTVVITLANHGSAPTDSATAILRSSSPYTQVHDSLGCYIHIDPDSSANNSIDPFIVSSDSNTPQGTLADFILMCNYGSYSDTINFWLVVNKDDYFIWNPDKLPKSGEKIHAILSDIGYEGRHDAQLCSDLNSCFAVFVCAGIYPNNYVIKENSSEASALADFVSSGGRLYIEGGDVWFYDPLYNNGFDFGPLFMINATADGGPDLGPITGQQNTFTQNMYFDYAGENAWIDHISPNSPSASLIFQDADNEYDCGVAYDCGDYQTVGTSFELGVLVDAEIPSKRAVLLDSIMHFFGLVPGISEKNDRTEPGYCTFQIFPNPCPGGLSMIITSLVYDQSTTLHIYDITGRLVKNIPLPSIDNGPWYITWDRTDLNQRLVPAGIYFIQLKNNNYSKTKKVILIK